MVLVGLEVVLEGQRGVEVGLSVGCRGKGVQAAWVIFQYFPPGHSHWVREGSALEGHDIQAVAPLEGL